MRSKTAQQNYDLEKAAELQYGKLPQLEKQLETEEEEVKNRDLSLVHENVSEEEIARIISRWTGIPVAKLDGEMKRNKTTSFDEELHKTCHRTGRGCHKGYRSDHPFQSRYQRSDKADRFRSCS